MHAFCTDLGSDLAVLWLHVCLRLVQMSVCSLAPFCVSVNEGRRNVWRGEVCVCVCGNV